MLMCVCACVCVCVILNESERQMLFTDREAISGSRRSEHVKLYSELLQAVKKEPLIALGSVPTGTLISSSTLTTIAEMLPATTRTQM